MNKLKIKVFDMGVIVFETELVDCEAIVRYGHIVFSSEKTQEFVLSTPLNNTIIEKA